MNLRAGGRRERGEGGPRLPFLSGPGIGPCSPRQPHSSSDGRGSNTFDRQRGEFQLFELTQPASTSAAAAANQQQLKQQQQQEEEEEKKYPDSRATARNNGLLLTFSLGDAKHSLEQPSDLFFECNHSLGHNSAQLCIGVCVCE